MLTNRGKWQNSFYFMNSSKLFFKVSEKFLMKEDKIRREEKKQSREGCSAALWAVVFL
jgi:hypothetical protein